MSPVTALTYVLPHRLLSGLARRLAYSTRPGLKQWLIDTVSRKFGVDMSEAAQPDPTAYPSFNAFFTRELRADARMPDPDPRALLMDEPLGALDKKLREAMQFEIKRIQRQVGATVLYVTHDQEEALTMSDRVAIMRGSKVLPCALSCAGPVSASSQSARPLNRPLARP